MTGKKAYTVNGTVESIDVSEFKAGTYIVLLQTAKGDILISRVIVK